MSPSTPTDGVKAFWSRPSTIEEGPGPWWLAAIVFGALAVGVVLVRWWPEAKSVRTWLAPAAMVIALVGAMVALAAGEVPFTVVALAAIAMGAALSEAPPRDNLAWSLVGPAVVALAPVLPLPSRSATLVVWLIAAAVLAAIVIRSKDIWRRELDWRSLPQAGAWELLASRPSSQTNPIGTSRSRWSLPQALASLSRPCHCAW